MAYVDFNHANFPVSEIQAESPRLFLLFFWSAIRVRPKSVVLHEGKEYILKTLLD